MTPRTQPDVIDTVVYDFGNVLVRWDPRGAYRGVDPAKVEAFFASFDFAAFNQRMDAGAEPFAAARARAAAATPRWAPFLDTYLERYADTLAGPVEGSAELVGELRGLGLRLYGLTNWWAETFHHAEPAAPAIGLMDGVVVSGRVGMAKPDPAIFRHLAALYGVTPTRAVFVDDSPVNVAAAAALGFHAVRFTTTAALRRALVRLGVGVRPPSD
ncbi:HAD family hydrolase [Xylanimonas ulmi]|uniref:2-haloacid dehalogenase n=1 Tax=Xylanimonas ulmi TaxID=228973 RepID=A0A4Q7M260_9MICO|nr:HAD family phosphatase [Xylanibacterium ulmi]RZS60907.1 2-haloacid dehalogenase [Xylanibacterium ulmi]